jgi:hypothetical protein
MSIKTLGVSEPFLHTGGVTGSIPVAPTMKALQNQTPTASTCADRSRVGEICTHHVPTKGLARCPQPGSLGCASSPDSGSRWAAEAVWSVPPSGPPPGKFSAAAVGRGPTRLARNGSLSLDGCVLRGSAAAAALGTIAAIADFALTSRSVGVMARTALHMSSLLANTM